MKYTQISGRQVRLRCADNITQAERMNRDYYTSMDGTHGNYIFYESASKFKATRFTIVICHPE